MKQSNETRNWIDYWDSQEAFDPVMKIAADRFFKNVAGLLGFGPEDVVLDIGCGPGALVDHLVGVVGEVHGVDTSPSMIARCRRRFAGQANVVFHELDSRCYTDLSFLPASHFTRVVCLSVVQYYREEDDLRRLIASVARVTKPGGRFLVADIPTGRSAIADACALMRSAVAGRFVWAAMRLILASLASQYRRVRRATGLRYYPREVLDEIAAEVAGTAEVVTAPLTSNPGRVHLDIRFPDTQEGIS